MNYYKKLEIPITLKPLPALLAPTLSNVSCASLPTGIIVHHDNMSTSEPSPLPNNIPLYSLIQEQSREIQELQLHLSQLTQKCVDQCAELHEAEQAQQRAASEIEDLSLALFEEANQMVSNERRARCEAEQKVQQLEQQLGHVMEELGHEKTQLGELREKWHETRDHVPALSTVCLDTDALFIDFLGMIVQTPLDQVNRLPFMKQCLELDVEPCLRFGHKKNQGQLKKILDTIVHHPCFIEPVRRHSHNVVQNVKQPSLTFLNTRKGCYMCGTQSTTFRFKLKETDKEWLWIDRPCRDRLVAVCDFYVFIRHVKAGLTSQKTIQDLVKQCVWLRLCMFWARTGVYHNEIKQ